MWSWLVRQIGRDNSAPTAFGVAALCVAVAAAILLGIDLFAHLNIRFAPFFPAVLAATLFGGWAAGVFAVVLSGVICWWMFIPPRFAFLPLDLRQAEIIAIYLAVAGSIVLIAEKYRQAQRQVDVTLQELTHRTKNLLAIILSISGEISKTSTDTRNFQDRFRDRLMSLALSHDMLVKSRWHTTDLHSTVAMALGPFEQKEMVTINGPHISISPQMVENIMMALNELMTNSVKYGALSHRGGTVKISWQVEGKRLHLVWDSNLDFFDENAPIRPGFGTLVLTRIVPRNLQGKADFTIGDGQVRWELLAPLRSR